MKAPKATDPTPDPEAVAASLAQGPDAEAEATPEAEPAPEPWTPERSLEWNRYYDLYVAGGVILLVLLVSCHRIVNSSIWPLIQAGRMTIESGAPLLSDPFSYASTWPGRRWINISWLFEVANALLMRIGPAVNSLDPERAFQISATAVIVATALVRVLTAWSLLAVRRSGPGLWWSAICVALALGVYVSPTSLAADTSLNGLLRLPVLGGLAGVAFIVPQVWGLLLLGVELLILFRVLDQGRRSRLLWLVPLFALWANIDESFLFGLFILAAMMVGNAIRPRRVGLDPEDEVSPGRGLLTLGLCALACLANPSHVLAFQAAWRPYQFAVYNPIRERTLDQLGFFGPSVREFFSKIRGDFDLYRIFQIYFASYVLIGLLSFVLNRRRFSLPRFLAFAMAAVLWGLLSRLSGEFGAVFAVVLALNGQEWYQDRFGVEGRIGPVWSLWSVGGRLVTLTVLTLAMIKATTGLGGLTGETFVGFGVEPTEFPFEAADFLRGANLQGKVLNTSAAMGDALIWRAPGEVQSFMDSRRNFYPSALLVLQGKILAALREGRKDGDDGWAALLDKYGITTLMVPSDKEPTLRRALRESPDWVEFYDGGGATLFGRADLPDHPDLAYFKAHRLDPDEMVYHRDQLVPSPDRSPTQVGMIDRVLRSRALGEQQPHVVTASRWLKPPPGQLDPLPDPARCILAIREARAALRQNPDDTDAFRVLATAYRDLSAGEASILASAGVEPSIRLQIFRIRQYITAVNYAIQTTPPPDSPSVRDSLRVLHLQLASLYRALEAFDLEAEQLEEAAKLAPDGGLEPADQKRLEALRKGTQEFRETLDKLAQENNWGPAQRATYASQAGALGRAIEELRTAETGGMRLGPVKAELIDLYCQIGQPDQAFDLMRNDVEDPELDTGPGTAAYRQGLVTLLALGNYDATSSFWSERSIGRLRQSLTTQGLGAGLGLLKGDAQAATASFLELPNRSLVEADWYYQLGLCLLEGGHPVAQTVDLGGRKEEMPGAAEMFTKALEIEPEMPVRPLIVYYLEKLGRPVPEIPRKAVPGQSPQLPENVFQEEKTDK